MKKKKLNGKLIAIVGVFAALSWALMFLKFPISYLGFLEVEFSDVPAIVGTLVFGPVVGVLVEFVKNLLHLFQTSTGGVGELANFIVSCGYILPLGLITSKRKETKQVISGCVVGSIVMAVIGAVVNIFIMMPMYITVMGGEKVLFNFIEKASFDFLPKLDSITKIVMIGITPFNIFKGIIISIAGVFCYRLLKAPLLQITDNQ